MVHMAGSGGMEMSIRGGGRTAGSVPFPFLVRGSVSKARLFVLDLRGARDRRANQDRFALPLFTQRRDLSPCSENMVQCAENVAPAPRYSRLTEEASEDTIKIRIKTLDDTKSWEVAPCPRHRTQHEEQPAACTAGLCVLSASPDSAPAFLC